MTNHHHHTWDPRWREQHPRRWEQRPRQMEQCLRRGEYRPRQREQRPRQREEAGQRRISPAVWRHVSGDGGGRTLGLEPGWVSQPWAQGTVQMSDAPFRAGFTSVPQSDFHITPFTEVKPHSAYLSVGVMRAHLEGCGEAGAPSLPAETSGCSPVTVLSPWALGLRTPKPHVSSRPPLAPHLSSGLRRLTKDQASVCQSTQSCPALGPLNFRRCWPLWGD